ncbi:hypothetical protein BN873_890025 [Candidatus Competibacter denitrificans Run_A_D11]|uniref:Uncharacterized protein n=1 Tax=Candidatus Competibacter denitrificans Run_A_D11 TaxID=1400863 RepID=W6MB78_9GAMM|nr:hypothetical protein BN873_890025 [Candidatus Competibacter denitrificans Run_A_D11]
MIIGRTGGGGISHAGIARYSIRWAQPVSRTNARAIGRVRAGIEPAPEADDPTLLRTHFAPRESGAAPCVVGIRADRSAGELALPIRVSRNPNVSPD